MALLLDYLHADAPSSLDFWRCAVCFKGKWPEIGHMDARTKWLTRVAATRRNTAAVAAVREGAMRDFFRRACVALLLGGGIPVAGDVVAIVDGVRVNMIFLKK